MRTMSKGKPVCDKCGYVFNPLIPQKTVISFMLESGENVTICRDCLCLLGSMTAEERVQFFRDLGVEEWKDEEGQILQQMRLQVPAERSREESICFSH